MRSYLLYASFGWLALSGVLHFVADVLNQYLRGKRAPGLETSLYYGLHSAFSLGQLAFGLLGLYLAWQAPALLRARPVLALSLATGLGWLAISVFFMEYREPKLVAAVFCVLMGAVFVAR